MSEYPEFIFSSDWHLSFGMSGKHPGMVGGSYAALHEIVDLCLTHNVPLIAAGDLFDKPIPDPVSVNVMCQEMQRMQDAGLAVYFTQGQHERVKRSIIASSTDQGGSPCWMNVHQWPVHVHGESFEIAGVKFFGLDWMPPEELEAVFAHRGHLPAGELFIPDDTDVLICHQVWKEFMGDHCNPECTIDQVPFVKTILTGDYHEQAAHVGTGRTGQQVLMISTGSTNIRSMGETPHKAVVEWWAPGATAGDHDNERIFSQARREGRGMPRPLETFGVYKYASLRECRNLIVVNLDTLEELDAFVADDLLDDPDDQLVGPTDPRLMKPMIRVNYNEELPDSYERITNKIGDRAFMFLFPRRNEQELSVITPAQEEAIRGQGLLGCLATLEDPESDLYRTIARLLESDEPGAELQVIQEAYLNDETNPAGS
jgi:hypothetical protein